MPKITCAHDNKTVIDVPLLDEEKDIEEIVRMVLCTKCKYYTKVTLRKGKIVKIEATDTFAL